MKRFDHFGALFSISAVLFSLGSVAVGDAPVNELTESEKQSGWRLLFDGKTTEGWRNYKRDAVSSGWQVRNGELARVDSGAGDIVTKEKFRFFELQLDYKISKGGNSGLMFHVTEQASTPWQTGPEIQIQDNVDGHDPQKSGWLYQLYKPQIPGWVAKALQTNGSGASELDGTRPAGEWNQLYVRIAPKNSQVCMNGFNYYRFTQGSKDWDERVAKSKFAEFPGFGKVVDGHICLQDHGNMVAFRNIKIRPHSEGNGPNNPVHGTLSVKPVLAFPELKWEGWDGYEDDGKKKTLRSIVLTSAPGQDDYLFSATQKGMIHRFKNDASVTRADLILDLREKVKSYQQQSANEEGLLGLAFHPDYPANDKFYVYYTRSDEKLVSVISEFAFPKGAKTVDPATERIVMEIKQPFQNHNGGCIEFGPDGFLYVGLGDGGLLNDPYKAGQDLSKLMGKVLRIDVNTRDDDRGYGIPKDNPFVARENALPEIYALGLRNVWRLSFDTPTGDLWVADVGQDLWEEINLVEKGGNYGWSVREGSHPFGEIVPEATTPLTDPVWEYDHQIGRSITGGHVYRGKRLPQLDGKYLYADYVSGRIWALETHAGSPKDTKNYLLVEGGMPVLAFGKDAAGEVYYMIESATGQTIYRFQ